MTQKPLSSLPLIDLPLSEDLSPNTLQRKASAPDWSIWVRASAGSGKTKVLSDRVLRLLLAGVAPNRILGLTFTKAAAAEMKIRIAQRLATWATCAETTLLNEMADLQNPAPPDPKQLDLARRLFALVLSCPGGMRIQTIHAFAQEILRRFPVEADLPPQFEVMEESAADDLRQTCYEALLQDAARAPDTALGRAFSTISCRLHETKLAALLKEAGKETPRRLATIEKNGGLSKTVVRMRAALGLSQNDTLESVLAESLRDNAFPIDSLREMARNLVEQGGSKGKMAGQGMLAFYALSETERSSGWESYLQALLTKDYEPGKQALTAKFIEKYPASEEMWSRETARVIGVLKRLDTVRLAEQTEALWILADDLSRRYAQAKDQTARLDFDDLITRAGALLSSPKIGPWVHYKLDGGIDHILVDEAQDTNARQWNIIDVLADEFFAGQGGEPDRARTLFVVGDEKQSIFSFMGSQAALFLEKQRFYRDKILAANRLYDDVPIHVSFRSAPAILRAVDAVFADAAARDGVCPEPVRHTAFRSSGRGHVELWDLVALLPKNNLKADAGADWLLPEVEEKDTEPMVALADQIVAKLLDWNRQGAMVFDKALKAERPFRFGDVMILVRKRGGLVDILVRKLKEHHIPVSGVDRMVLPGQRAVKDVLALLNFLLLPEDDLTLAELLRGPMVGVSEDQMMELCIGRSGSVWDSLCRAARGDAFWEQTRLWLEGWMDRADRLLPMELIAQILSAPCPADKGSARRAIWGRLGPESQDPLDELIGAAEAQEKMGVRSLQAFLHGFETSENEIKREMEQAAGQVRIVTVHSAKGLEAPIVILPDCAQTPSLQSLPSLLWYGDFQLYGAGCGQSEVWRRLQAEALAVQMQEYRRLFYVALTRAADRVCVAGWLQSNGGNFEQSWYQMARRAWASLDQEALHSEGVCLAFADDPHGAPMMAPKEMPQSSAPQSTAQAEIVPLPAWFFAPPPDEPLPPRPLAPSRPDEEDPPVPSPIPSARFIRGLVTHRLLQSLPDLQPSARRAAAARYLSAPQHGLSEAQQIEILDETLKLFEDPALAPFFAEGARAEVPVVGLAGGRVVAGQIDRLGVTGQEVWILDYKTNRPPPTDPAAVPATYVRQMAAYRAVLHQIYPSHAIRCFILWTYLPRLVEVPRAALEKAFPSMVG